MTRHRLTAAVLAAILAAAVLARPAAAQDVIEDVSTTLPPTVTTSPRTAANHSADHRTLLRWHHPDTNGRGVTTPPMLTGLRDARNRIGRWTVADGTVAVSISFDHNSITLWWLGSPTTESTCPTSAVVHLGGTTYTIDLSSRMPQAGSISSSSGIVQYTQCGAFATADIPWTATLPTLTGVAVTYPGDRATISTTNPAVIDESQLRQWTWEDAIGRMASCWTSSETTAEDMATVETAARRTPADEAGDNILSRTWSFLSSIPGNVATGVTDTVTGIGRWLTWTVQAIGCMMWETFAPNPAEFTAVLLRGPTVDCRTVTGDNVGDGLGGEQADRTALLVCEDIGLVSWPITTLTVLSTGARACAGPEIMISELLAPVTNIVGDADDPASESFISMAELETLDGRYLSTCDGTTLGQAADLTRGVLSGLLFLFGAFLLLGCGLALPRIISAGEVR